MTGRLGGLRGSVGVRSVTLNVPAVAFGYGVSVTADRGAGWSLASSVVGSHAVNGRRGLGQLWTMTVFDLYHGWRFVGARWRFVDVQNKKHLKNVGPIRHNEPPHAHSADVASGTVARRLRIDVHDDNDNYNA